MFRVSPEPLECTDPSAWGLLKIHQEGFRTGMPAALGWARSARNELPRMSGRRQSWHNLQLLLLLLLLSQVLHAN